MARSHQDTGERLDAPGVEALLERVRAAERRAALRARQTAAVAAVGELAVLETDMGALLDAAMARAVEAFEADIGSILLVEGDQLLLHAAIGLAEELVGTHVVPLGPTSSLAGYALSSPDPVVVRFLASETRFTPPAALLDAEVASGISVVLRSNGRNVGVLSVYTRAEQDFDDDDVNVMRSMANVVSYAMERHEVHEHLSRVAVTDELTSLPNRTLFLDRLGNALRRRRTLPVAVVFGDLDHFKDVNDALGHACGDDLLRAVAARLTNHLRDGDTVARFGGDEFAVLCEDVDGVSGALDLADRVTRAVAAEPFTTEGRAIHMTISTGVVVTSGAEHDPHSVLRDADAAMYRAKSKGRGRVELFDDEMRATVVARLDLSNDLASAVSQRQLALRFQPEVRLGGSEVWAEALVRWEHPERGLLAPGLFIDLAEETGAILPIGRWVLEHAAAQMARWALLPAGHAPTAISVNVSPRQLVDDDLVTFTADVLDHYALDPSSLWLELTETALLRDPERAISTLHALKELGVGLAIDDFGTGYSSLTYARSLPVDALKIDRSFISGVGTDLRDPGIVHAIIGLARSFGVITIAEGVETEAQMEALRLAGCDYAQGYLLTRPIVAADLEDWVHRRAIAGSASP